ncbi:MAG: RsbRD N-terminal domain-containing protein [Thermodesulfovibrio sp.]|nr:RsbRD N-terminal domain-containing protein [Thermodesulfovibrio sp.]MCX7723626.1 RsbRD N-terminal domain-containing protein [Thermodesulfovibrio sp.]
MSINSLLSKKRDSVVKEAFDLIICTYPQQSQIFLREKHKRFTNPIGYNTNVCVEQIIDNIIADADVESFLPALENIIQIRAVQDFTPSQAVGFIFLIKKAIYNALHKEADSEELMDLMSRIDSLALIAFDIFMKYRERIYDIKARELMDRTWWLLKKWNIVTEIDDKISENK